MTELIEWVCKRCDDRVCTCQIPPDTYPQQVLNCISFTPDWRIEGVVPLDEEVNIDFLKELVRDALLTDGEHHLRWYLVKIAEEIKVNIEDIEDRGIPP